MKYLLAVLLLTAAPAYAANWKADPAQSSIRFQSTESGQPFTGQFKGFTADITFDPTDLANAKADVVIDVTDAKTGSGERDSELKEDKWLAIEKFPTARFTTSAFRHIEGNKYEADGTLTIRDVTKPLTLPFTLDITGDTAKMTGEITLARADYAIGAGSSEDKSVGPDVKVLITVLAQRS